MTGAWRYTTGADCVRRWHFYSHVGPAEVVRAVASVCIRAAALALPLALPSAAFVPFAATNRPHGLARPMLSGPAYEIGALFIPGVYEVPALAALPVQAGQTYPYAGGLQPSGGNAAVDESSTLTPMLSGDVPHWLPDRDVAGQGVPTEVPEPSAWMVLVATLVGLLVVRRWVR